MFLGLLPLDGTDQAGAILHFYINRDHLLPAKIIAHGIPCFQGSDQTVGFVLQIHLFFPHSKVFPHTIDRIICPDLDHPAFFLQTGKSGFICKMILHAFLLPFPHGTGRVGNQFPKSQRLVFHQFFIYCIFS